MERQMDPWTEIQMDNGWTDVQMGQWMDRQTCKTFYRAAGYFYKEGISLKQNGENVTPH